MIKIIKGGKCNGPRIKTDSVLRLYSYCNRCGCIFYDTSVYMNKDSIPILRCPWCGVKQNKTLDFAKQQSKEIKMIVESHYGV